MNLMKQIFIMSLRGVLVFCRSSLLILGDCFVGTPALAGGARQSKCPPRNDIFLTKISKVISIFLLSSFLLFSCTPATQTSFQTQIVNVYATSAAQPWLTELYDCASDLGVTLKVDANNPAIFIRIGEPETIISPVYQIDEEEILIVANRESSVQNLSFEEAQQLFAQGNSSVQVWAYSSDTDMQIVFDQLVMKGRSVISLARVAVSAQAMSDVLNSESSAVGILPKNALTGNMREVFSAGTVPVLAITKEEPQGVIVDLIACLQNN
jgi:hypothetical protein